jgi:5-methylcytosine-specific restriction enzyme subunit McrC
MKTVKVLEYSRLYRGSPGGSHLGADPVCLEPRLYDRLRAFDFQGRAEGDRVFEWADGHACARQWVGVIQVPGLQVEILPKTDSGSLPEGPTAAQPCARSNLLFMMEVAGEVPLRARDLAALRTETAPISETLAALFAKRLQDELLLGPERAYLELEENLATFKGRLLVAQQIRHNAANNGRFHCRFQAFELDTPLNRIFKAACRNLLAFSSRVSTQEDLKHCLALLDEVSDQPVQDEDFDRIILTRQNQRFRDLLVFCRLLLAGKRATAQSGSTTTFSLLFDMNKVFERFIARFLRTVVGPRHLPGVTVHPQAGHLKRCLMECEGSGILRLQPDLVIEGPDGSRLVMDTKWKLLAPTQRGAGGVSNGDLYQLFAYTKRFGCSRSVLLYPHTDGLVPRRFSVLGTDGLPNETLAICQANLNRDLRKDRAALAVELAQIITHNLDLAQPTAGVS